MELPDWTSIPRMLRDQAAHHPADVVVAGTDLAGARTTLTLADLVAGAARVARALLALGVETGDRVAIWAPNTPEWVVTAYGVWDAGGVIAPLSTRFRGLEAADLLAKVEAKVLIVADGFMDTPYLDLLAEATGGSRGGPEHVVTYGGPRPGALAWEEFLAAGDAVPARAAEDRALSVTGDDLGEIMATSGTTGAPKGVMLQIGRAHV